MFLYAIHSRPFFCNFFLLLLLPRTVYIWMAVWISINTFKYGMFGSSYHGRCVECGVCVIIRKCLLFIGGIYVMVWKVFSLFVFPVFFLLLLLFITRYFGLDWIPFFCSSHWFISNTRHTIHWRYVFLSSLDWFDEICYFLCSPENLLQLIVKIIPIVFHRSVEFLLIG